MADDGSPSDSLDIGVKLALEQADRDYEAFKKKVETPLRIPVSTSDGSVATGRTFSGASVVTGPTNTSPNAPLANVGQVSGLQQLILNRTIGGSGFSPAAGPVPTAATNTYYGDASRAFTSNPYQVASSRISSLPTIDQPSVSGDGFNSGGAAYNGPPIDTIAEKQARYYERLRDRSLTYANSVNRQQVNGYERMRDRSLAYANQINREMIRDAERAEPVYGPGGGRGVSPSYRPSGFISEGDFAVPLSPAGGGGVSPSYRPRGFISEGDHASPIGPLNRPSNYLDERDAVQTPFDQFVDDEVGGGGGPPLSPSDFSRGRSGLRSLRAGRQGPGFFERNFPNLRSDFGRALTGYSLLRTATGAFAGPNAYALGQAQNAGNFAASSADAIANDPTRGFVESIPIVGDLASQAGEFITGSRAAAARTLGAASIQDRIGGLQRNQALSLQTSQLSLQTAQASLANPFAGQLAAISAKISQIEPNRQASVDAGRAPLDAGLDAANNAISNFDARGDVKLRQFFGNNAGIAEARQKLVTDRDSAKTKLDNFIENTRAEAANDTRTLRTQAAQIEQDDQDNATTLSTSRGRRQRAAGLTLSGDTFGGELAGIDAEFGGTIDSANREIERARAAGLEPSQTTFQQRDDAIAARDTGKAFARRARLNELGDLAGDAAVTAGSIGFDPFGGRLRGSAARFGARLRGLNADSDQANILNDQQTIEQAGIRQQQAFFNADVNADNEGDARIQQDERERDPFGADAERLAKAGKLQVRQLARSGASDDQIRARQSIINGAFDQQRRDVGLSFRAENFDARLSSDREPRDGLDPAKIFKDISDAQSNFNSDDPKIGKDISDPIVKALDDLGKRIEALGTD